MTALRSECSVAALRDYLAGEMSNEAERQIVDHLDVCPACQQRLELLAASPEDWKKVRSIFCGLQAESPAVLIQSSLPALTLPEAAASVQDSNDLVSSIVDFLAPSDDPEMIGRLGPYEIKGIIGQGGMGVVLKAYDRALQRTVAIKILAPALATSAVARRRFAREAQAAAAVVHDCIISIYAVAESNRVPYLVMPYLPGGSLQHRLDEEGVLAIVEVVRIAYQVAAGLAEAHAQGLVHRDIKPANILLGGGIERVTITDFGLARAVDDASMTLTGIVAGTPEYMSPEQARGEAVDYRADLFSLGSVMYSACAGRPAFRAKTTFGVLKRICEDEPTPLQQLNPEVPGWLAAIISRLLAKDPNARYQTAGELVQILEQCLAHLQSPSLAPLPEIADQQPKASGRRHTQMIGVASTLFAVLAICLIFLAVSGDRRGSSIDADKSSRVDEGLVTPAAPTGLARATYELVENDFYSGRLDDPELVYRWSLRCLNEERNSDDGGASAVRAHLQRMLAMQEAVTRRDGPEMHLAIAAFAVEESALLVASNESLQESNEAKAATLLPYLERVYMAAVQQCLNSESCDPDCAIRWSRRWLDQQQIVSNSSAQPRLDHRDRMKSLSQAIAVRVREGKATEIATQKMQASLQEAELLLN